MPIPPVDKPLRIVAEEVMVLIDGQDGIAITMAAEAAIAIGYRLNNRAALGSPASAQGVASGPKGHLGEILTQCAIEPMPMSQKRRYTRRPKPSVFATRPRLPTPTDRRAGRHDHYHRPGTE